MRAAPTLSSTTRIRRAWLARFEGSTASASRTACRIGKRTTNRLPCPGPSLCAVIEPSCISTSRCTRRQADPQSALGPVERTGRLREQLKDVRQKLRFDADARILHADDRLPVLTADRQFDPAAAIRVFDRRC